MGWIIAFIILQLALFGVIDCRINQVLFSYTRLETDIWEIHDKLFPEESMFQKSPQQAGLDSVQAMLSETTVQDGRKAKRGKKPAKESCPSVEDKSGEKSS